MRTAPAQRIVSGSVTLAGTNSGPGWQASKIGTGAYRVRFMPPFRAAPDAVGSASQTGGLLTTATAATAPDGVDFWVYSAGGSVDSAFRFVAIGIPL
jgi:hypothetical protein